MKPRIRTAIEQAIARGWPVSRIMRDLNVSYDLVREVRDGMEPDPCTVEVDPRVLMVGGRPLSSYFGPAHPSVIEALVDAICPLPKRTRKAA